MSIKMIYIKTPEIILNQYKEQYSFFVIFCLCNTAAEKPISTNISVNEMNKRAIETTPKSLFCKNLVNTAIWPSFDNVVTMVFAVVHLTAFIIELAILFKI